MQPMAAGRVNLEGLLLGISSGAVCLAYCAPVLVTYLLAEGSSVLKNLFHLVFFLGGRLLGYLMFGFLAWIASLMILKVENYRDLIFGTAYIVLSITMILYSLGKMKTVCSGSVLNNKYPKAAVEKQMLYPVLLGFLTGINLCPPFLLAFTASSNSLSLLHSMGYFVMFFLGTTIYIIPLSFLGLAKKYEAMRTIARIAAIIISVYYLYTGISMLCQGILNYRMHI